MLAGGRRAFLLLTKSAKKFPNLKSQLQKLCKVKIYIYLSLYINNILGEPSKYLRTT